MPKNYKKLKRPINLKFGDHRVKMGYDIRLTDGTEILAAAVGDMGLHISFHPSGLVKVSDNTGFDSRWDISKLDVSQIDPGYVEELFLENISQDFEPTGEAIAMVPRSGHFQPPIRKTRRFVDIDVLKGLEWVLTNSPFWQIEENYVEDFIEKMGVEGAFIMCPESEQIALVVDERGKIFPFHFGKDFIPKLLGLTDLLPEFTGLGCLFKETIDHVENLFKDEIYGFQGYFQSQFEQIDFDAVARQITPRFENFAKSKKFFQRYPS